MRYVATNEAAAACGRKKKIFLETDEDSFEGGREGEFKNRTGDGSEADLATGMAGGYGDDGDGKGSALENAENVPPCPKCGAPMEPIRHEGEIIFYGCTRFKETGCRGKWFKDKTSDDQRLYLKCCPECHQGLKRGFGRNGQPYCACFEAEDHESKAPLFFTHDGKPKPRLTPKGEFHCPECDGRLSYFMVQNGLYTGRKTFACFNADKHASKRAHYWEDQNGKPSW